MKRIFAICLILAVALAYAGGVTSATVSDLLGKPDKFDQKDVRTSGKVEGFAQKTSRAGNAYFVFKLTDKEDKVSVYGQGKLEKPPVDGDKIEVTGKFRKENKVGTNVFRNEIQTTTVGIKLLK